MTTPTPLARLLSTLRRALDQADDATGPIALAPGDFGALRRRLEEYDAATAPTSPLTPDEVDALYNFADALGIEHDHQAGIQHVAAESARRAAARCVAQLQRFSDAISDGKSELDDWECAQQAALETAIVALKGAQ